MTQHSPRATSPLENGSLRSRIVKKSWPVRPDFVLMDMALT